MTDRRIALLRGINVGKAKRIAMADLRSLFEDLGFGDVATLLNSGNVVFTVKKKTAGDLGQKIAMAILEKLDVATKVTVLAGDEIAEALDKNPLEKIAIDPSKFLIMVLADEKATKVPASIAAKDWAPEAVAIKGRMIYLWCPGGIIDSPLQKAVARVVGENGTARNHATMTKLLALAKAE